MCDNVHRFIVPGSYVNMAHERIDVPYHEIPYPPDYSSGKLHHYFVQSRADWEAKLNRGYHDTTRNLSDFEMFDRNEVIDMSAERYAGRVEEVLFDVFGSDRPRYG